MNKRSMGWENSFPRAQIDGQDWICAVLEDLADYCQENNRYDLEVRIRNVLDFERKHNTGSYAGIRH